MYGKYQMDKKRLLKAIEQFILQNPVTEDEAVMLLEEVGDKLLDGYTMEAIVEKMNFDMLEDIMMRNKKFTDFTRANNPRGKEVSTPESLLIDLSKDAVLTPVGKKAVDDALVEIGMLRNALALHDEVTEYQNELPWKWWGRGVWHLNKEKALEELIDLIHFVFVSVDDMGFTPVDFYNAYVKKNQHNWKRFQEKIGWNVSANVQQDSPLDNREKVKVTSVDKCKKCGRKMKVVGSGMTHHYECIYCEGDNEREKN
jgi:hypothetical protein